MAHFAADQGPFYRPSELSRRRWTTMAQRVLRTTIPQRAPHDDPWPVLGYGSMMIDVSTRKRNLPAPPSVVFEALTEPERPAGRPWLRLLEDELRPQIVESDEPTLVIWSSIWPKRSDAVIRFDLLPSGGGTDLRWTLSAEEPIPDEALLNHLGKRMNQLINAELRYSFGQ